jgi:conjugal transfer mating pair stabilization protein TraG
MSSEQLAEFKQFGDRVSRDAGFMSAISNDSHEANDMTARLASTHARSERAEASLAERLAFAERVSAAQEKGESISIDIAQDPHNLEMFMRYSEQYGGNSAAAHALMESELARQSLRPNRVFSDGTALPASFGDIREQHAQQRSDAALTPEIDGLHHPTDNKPRGLRVTHRPSERQPPYRRFEMMFAPVAIKFARMGHQAVQNLTPRPRSLKPMTERLHPESRYWFSRANRWGRTPERRSRMQRIW